MESDYMENLARAYNVKLHGSANPQIESATDILRQQIALLTNSPYARRKLVSYAISLKESSLNALRGMDEGKKIPSYRMYEGCSANGSGVLSKVADLEVELYILLDTMSSDGADVVGVLDTETRFTALLGNIR